MLGILGVSFLIIFLLQAWSKAESQLDVFIRRAGQGALFHAIFQGLFDISILHLPILQVFTGITWSIPFSIMTSEYALLFDNDWSAADAQDHLLYPIK